MRLLGFGPRTEHCTRTARATHTHSTTAANTSTSTVEAESALHTVAKKQRAIQTPHCVPRRRC
jgi:hypothetical protein